MGLKIGDLQLKHGILLAPMAGVTDRSFRRLCYQNGAELSVSEMVSAKALCYEQIGKRRDVETSGTAPLAAIGKDEGPTSIQIFGHEPEFMAEAAKLLESSSYRGCTTEVSPISIDINMGCPVKKITANGEGSALMKDPRLAGEICAAVSSAIKLPVTVKIRAGWDKQSINAPEIAKILEASGAAAICVHARTRAQLYSPGIDMSVIKAVKEAVSIPVIGNGDILCGADAVRMIEETGCDGVMIGRGAMGNPWIFSETVACLEKKEWASPDNAQRIDTAYAQLESMIAHKGERVGLAEGKKHMAWYLSGMRGASAARHAIMNSKSKEEIFEIFQTLREQISE